MPAFGLLTQSHTAMSLFRLGQHLQMLGIPAAASTVSLPDIVDARNLFLTLWYDNSDASHLLFVDADMDFDSNLIVEMIKFGQPVVGALYPARVLPLKFVGKAAHPHPADSVVNGFIKVGGVGAGIMLIERDCITKMLAADPALSSEKRTAGQTVRTLMDQMGLNRIIHGFDQLIVDDVKMSEDLSFCRRWQTTCGGEIWANIVYEIGHTGAFRFAGRYVELFTTEPPANA